MKLKFVFAGLAAAAAIAVLPAQAAAPVTDTKSVFLFSDNSVVGTSTLMRFPKAVQMTLQTTGLPANHIVTVWWVIFNHPEFCTHGGEVPRCQGDNFGDSRVEASAVHAAGQVIGATGDGRYGAYLPVGSTQEQILFGPGLTNPLGADIHLIVHDHDSLSALQSGSTIGREINSIGTVPGADLQASVHEAQP
ncbi:MAG: hypothetical protein KGJ55_04095 [Gammaproteobacteria bacterium]|nr:hypothetical protein [Gammaproteobacteria bacterium]